MSEAPQGTVPQLTGLDFPGAFSYGEEGFWVREDGAGACRVGLHFYTLETDDPVLHVQLPRAGAVVLAGDVIGHLDFGSRTLPLVAPVSGLVFLPNPDLRRDPDLVRRDAFGRGYLLDMEEVEETDFDRLLEADDAMAYYSQFDVEGIPRAQMMCEPDRPWWTRLTYKMGDTVLATAEIVPPLSNETFVPDWQIGDTWAIECTQGGVTRTFDYEVSGEAKVGGELCFRVTATERAAPDGGLSAEGVSLSPPPITRELYYRQDTFTLVAWDLVPEESPTLFKRTWNPRGPGSAYVHFGEEDGFFYDHPFIPPGRFDHTRDLPEIESLKLPAVIDHYRFRGGGFRCEIEERATLLTDVGVPERFFSQQIWLAGRPFWTEAVRMRGDKVLAKARLSVDEAKK